MSANYGVGILSAAGEGEADEADQIAWLERFAALGLTTRFREIVGERVIELMADEDGQVTSRWLEPAEARPIVEAAERLGGSAPYSAFPDCLDIQVYVPGSRTEGELGLADTPVEGWGYQPLEVALEALQDELESGTANDRELAESILAELHACAAHGLIFTIEY